MALYAIGDIQGCHRTLQRLLVRIQFDPNRDRLWLVGDLVNRGPASLEVLRWARGLDPAATVVLGNHDLHLLARAAGLRRSKARDTFQDVLKAADRDELLDWLRQRPFLHREGDRVLIHAGLLPAWTADAAEGLAREAAAALQEGALAEWIRHDEEEPEPWHPGLRPRRRLRLAVQAFTSLRTCTPEGRACPGFHGPPEDAPAGCLPWFEVPGRKSAGVTVVCGHWSTLGLRVQAGLVALDTGCVWGGPLTAVRLEDRAVFQEPLADRV
jgi:bis(5'-nucleosyl)-tetraphosphatase (symmetrical)